MIRLIFDIIWMSLAGIAFIRFVAIPMLAEMERNKRRLKREVYWYRYQNRFN